ncbi:MAG: tetratricopeptide repeat protein, partial [bacterium]
LFSTFSGDRMSPAQLRKTMTVFLAVVTACFINPYFHKGAVYPFQFFKFFGKNPYGFSTNILEFISPFKILYHNEAFYWYLVLLAIAILVIVLKFNSFQTWELLTFFFFLILSFLARRNLLFFALITIPLTARGLEALLTPGSKGKRNYEKWLAPVLLLATLWVAGDHFPRFYEKRHGMQLGFWGVREDAYPRAAAEFIVDSDLQGNMFNDMGIGGYLIYRLAPERKVFIDGRNIDEGLFSEFLKATQSYQEFQRLANKYQFNYIVIESRAPYLKNLVRNLNHDKTWKKVYFDTAIEIFVKNTPENQPMIFSAISHFKLPDHLSFYQKGMVYLKMGFPQFALNAFLKEIKVNPENSKALNNLAMLFEKFGKPDEAEKYYLLAQESDPDNHLICFNLAYFYEKQGKIKEAMDLYGKTLSLKPDFAPARQRLEGLQRKD